MDAVSHASHIPLAIEVYEAIMPIYEVALGVYYQSSYYVARRPVYKAETVHFDRFSYDFVSLFGVNLLFIELDQLEQIARKVYAAVSYNFPDGVQLIAPACVEEAFTAGEFSRAHNLESQAQLAKQEAAQRRAERLDSQLAGGPTDDGANADTALPEEQTVSIFGHVKTVEETLAEEKAKRVAKLALVDKIKEKAGAMRPFVLFTGVKDNPMPYEKMYLKNQAQKRVDQSPRSISPKPSNNNNNKKLKLP